MAVAHDSLNDVLLTVSVCYFHQNVVPLHPFKEKSRKKWLDI